MPERKDRPHREVTKEPPQDNADVCLLCARVIRSDELAIRTHGIWVHRPCYVRDVNA
jgi:hypothetical protein